MTTHSDEPARPNELRWTITKGVGQSGTGYYMVEGPDIRRMEVMPAQVTQEMVERVMGVLDEIASDAAAGRLDRRHCEEDAEHILRVAFQGGHDS